MFDPRIAAHYETILTGIRDGGLWKEERVLEGAQGARIQVRGRSVLNFCANNYLGLAGDARLAAAAARVMEERGYGLSSVRFICGTQDRHKELEARISSFLGTDDTILYSSCFDANGGLFETLLGEEDAIVSDALNHASIIDGIRLCKARRFRYESGNMADLAQQLEEAKGARHILVATDGVFSMDGSLARLPEVCDLAERHGAMVMVDDSHAVGFVGRTGRGTHEHHGVMGRIDLITGTLGKALGGASGGYTSGRKPLIDLLRQRSRPYLFSNTVAPAIVGAGLEAFRILSESTALRDHLEVMARRFRTAMERAGFSLLPGEHPIVPIMLGDAKVAGELARRLLDEGIYVIGFSYPVVPHGKARIRVQISAAHDETMVDEAVAAFTRVGRQMGLVP